MPRSLVAMLEYLTLTPKLLVLNSSIAKPKSTVVGSYSQEVGQENAIAQIHGDWAESLEAQPVTLVPMLRSPATVCLGYLVFMLKSLLDSIRVAEARPGSQQLYLSTQLHTIVIGTWPGSSMAGLVP